MKPAKKIKEALLLITLILLIVVSCTKTETITPDSSCSTTVPNGNTDETKTLETHNHYLDTATANAMIMKFQANRNAITNNSLPGQPEVIPLSESFNRRAIQNLLLQDSCVGIRISYGLNSQNELVAILSGISVNGILMNTPQNPCDSKPPYFPNCKIEIGIRPI